MAEYAEIPGVTPKMMMWAGLLHDVGKALIPVELLNKTSKFDAADRAAMEPHVMHGWELLQKIHEYTAHVIVRHHRYGREPYPKTLPPLPYHLEPKQETIDAAARLLALADYYDALTTRNNDRNPGCESLIQRLERASVLTFETP
jgi:HD-GYP domain-containing protein (c-di-GMP phosphodiesterase class II)